MLIGIFLWTVAADDFEIIWHGDGETLTICVLMKRWKDVFGYH